LTLFARDWSSDVCSSDLVTSAPINRIPERLAWLRDFLLGRPLGSEQAVLDDADEDGADEEDEVHRPLRRGPARRRQGALARDLKTGSATWKGTVTLEGRE